MSDPTITPIPGTSDAWESEGGSLGSLELAERLGVIRHVTESYSVGEFRYTSLADAIAQARRMTALERELLA